MTAFQEYQQAGSDTAFRSVVEAHSGLVFGTALRISRDQELSKEITQNVFLALVKKAGSIKDPLSLPAWLYQTAVHESRASLRREIRYRTRLENLQQEITVSPHHESREWSDAKALLDEVISDLPTPDQDLLILHFYERKTFRQISAIAKISEAACQKRVRRIVERLQKTFARKGVAITTVAISSRLSGEICQTAPQGLNQMVANKAAALSYPSQGASESLLTKIKNRSFLQASLLVPVLKTTVMKTTQITTPLAAVACLSGAAYIVMTQSSPEPIPRTESEDNPGLNRQDHSNSNRNSRAVARVRSNDPYNETTESPILPPLTGEVDGNSQSAFVSTGSDLDLMFNPSSEVVGEHNPLSINVMEAESGERLDQFRVLLVPSSIHFLFTRKPWGSHDHFSHYTYSFDGGKFNGRLHQGESDSIHIRNLPAIQWNVIISSPGCANFFL